MTPEEMILLIDEYISVHPLNRTCKRTYDRICADFESFGVMSHYDEQYLKKIVREFEMEEWKEAKG